MFIVQMAPLLYLVPKSCSRQAKVASRILVVQRMTQLVLARLALVRDPLRRSTHN